MPRRHDGEAPAQPDIAFGWVYSVDGEFGAGEPIPAEAIIGAWETDGYGQPAGEFVRNPGYTPREPGRPLREEPLPEAPLPAAAPGLPLA